MSDRMASIDRLVTLSEPLLPEGCHIRHAFVCQAARNGLLFVINYLTYLTIHWITYRVVCVTDDAIYVFSGTKFAIKPKELLATLPRETTFGPVSGRWAVIQLLGERHWVHQRFHGEINAADREAPRSP